MEGRDIRKIERYGVVKDHPMVVAWPWKGMNLRPPMSCCGVWDCVLTGII